MVVDCEAAGNTATAGAMLWSGASVALLLLTLAGILYIQHRCHLTAEDVEQPNLRFDVARNVLTPSQSATAKYFVIAIVLFLVQTLLGGKMAHDYADGASFYGINIADILESFEKGFWSPRSWTFYQQQLIRDLL